MKKIYTMSEVSAVSKLPYETLKFYCNEGLVPFASKGENGRRVFDEYALDWVLLLDAMRRAGMTLEEIRNFLEMVQAGEDTVMARREILEEVRKVLRQEAEVLREREEFLREKIEYYRRVE